MGPCGCPQACQESVSCREARPPCVTILELRAALGREGTDAAVGASSCDLYCQYMWKRLGVAWQQHRPACQRCLHRHQLFMGCSQQHITRRGVRE